MTSPDGQPARGRSLAGGAALITLATLVAYAAIVSAGFIWDDNDYVTDNPCLRDLAGLLQIWTEPGATPQYYPMVFSLFWLQYHLWGPAPLPYHLVNILLHILNALLLWRCVKDLRIPGAFWAAFIFALHPVNVESVAWITELKNVLSTSFYLAAFLSYCRFSTPEGDIAGNRHRWPFYFLSLILFGGALCSKTVTGSLPAAILLIYWWKQGRIPWRELLPLLPFFAAAIAMGRITAYLEVHHVLAVGPDWDFSFTERVLIAGRAVWFYAGKLLWPHPLIFIYPRWHIDTGVWWQYLFPAAAVLLVAALWAGRRRIGRGPVTGVLFFIGTLFPALGFFNVYPMLFSFVADHFQYLASTGLIVSCSAAATRLFAGRNRLSCGRRRLCLGFGLLILGVLTFQQVKIYRNNLSLFSDVIARNRTSWLAHLIRGLIYAGEQKYDPALEDFEKTLELRPQNTDALNNRAALLALKGEYDRALQDYETVLALKPSDADLYVNRSKVYVAAGRLDAALGDCERALQLAPASVHAHLWRGKIHALRDEYEQAEADLDEVARLAPENPEGHANRGLVHYRRGRPDLAVAAYSEALRLDPESAQVLYSRGVAYAAGGERDRALRDLKQARNLGVVLSDGDIAAILAASPRK